MTVSELINKLKDYPADQLVVVDGYETGFDDIEKLEPVSIVLFTKKEWWNGRYELKKAANAVPAVSLSGNREYKHD
jgi:hypothetical protein